MLRQETQPRRVALLLVLVAFIAVALTTWWSGQQTAQAGPPEAAVVDWNLYAIDALINAPTAVTPGAGQTPPVSIQHLAMVQGAVYDAVNSIDGGHDPYLVGLPTASPSASMTAAVATAAHDVLVGVEVVPALSDEVIDRLDGLRDDSINAAIIQDGAAAVAAGIAAGEAAAEAMLGAREDDGRYGSFKFTPGTDPGAWALTPPAFVNDPFAWVARVDPFVLKSTSQFRTEGPPALSSSTYAKEYKEVKDFGGNGTTTSTVRTPEQTALARFYTAHPPEMFNRTFRAIAETEGLTLVEQARFFAMLNMAAADALINCWDDKAYWNFWRPITAIRRGDEDGNSKTVADTQWTSLAPSPPYPDHPSGYNCVTSAFMHTAEAFFDEDNIAFDVTAFIGSPPAPVTRSYERFTDVVNDTVDARVYLGIHFRTPDKQGAGIGRDVAHWLHKNYFRPVKD